MPGIRIGLKNSTKAMPNPRGAITKNTVPVIKPSTNDLIITLVKVNEIGVLFLLYHLNVSEKLLDFLPLKAELYQKPPFEGCCVPVYLGME